MGFGTGEDPDDDEPLGPGAAVLFVGLVFALIAVVVALLYLFFIVMWWGN